VEEIVVHADLSEHLRLEFLEEPETVLDNENLAGQVLHGDGMQDIDPSQSQRSRVSDAFEEFELFDWEDLDETLRLSSFSGSLKRFVFEFGFDVGMHDESAFDADGRRIVTDVESEEQEASQRVETLLRKNMPWCERHGLLVFSPML
jgi:hypothetical protein